MARPKKAIKAATQPPRKKTASERKFHFDPRASENQVATSDRISKPTKQEEIENYRKNWHAAVHEAEDLRDKNASLICVLRRERVYHQLRADELGHVLRGVGVDTED